MSFTAGPSASYLSRRLVFEPVHERVVHGQPHTSLSERLRAAFDPDLLRPSAIRPATGRNGAVVPCRITTGKMGSMRLSAALISFSIHSGFQTLFTTEADTAAKELGIIQRQRRISGPASCILWSSAGSKTPHDNRQPAA